MAASTLAAELADWVEDARQRTLDLVADLSDEQLRGPRLPIVNPLIWEIGHVAWFQEKWVLRRDGAPSVRPDADALYDSIAIPHDVRWDLPLPSREDTLAYLVTVRDRVLERLAGGEPSETDAYFVRLSVFHEDMHDEAFTYTRQTLGYPPPRFTEASNAGEGGEAGPLPGDAEIAGGTFLLGAVPGRDPFVFDNEKWAHPVDVRPFALARAPVTQAEFAAFVDDGGYRRRAWWSEAGWQWRERVGAEHPVYWRKDGAGWLRRHFDRWVRLEPHRPVVHVNWYEAEAYCRWAGRRLPTEVEWEVAAATEPTAAGALGARKRRYPWGDDPPSAERANLDWRGGAAVDVAAHPAGESAWGCRQMLGNVWEWTCSVFGPYPGFVPDPYKEYSAPWFGDHRVLRGGAWTTRGRLLRNTWRNFYKPDRRDVWAGFRTARDLS
jgi:iron(II)-dependent oxidoreductase